MSLCSLALVPLLALPADVGGTSQQWTVRVHLHMPHVRFLCCHVQLPALLNARALHAEVDRITKAGQSGPPGLWLASLPKAKSGSDAALQLVTALLRWAQVICGKSGLVIRGWASSFADGQAICLLVSCLAAVATKAMPLQC